MTTAFVQTKFAGTNIGTSVTASLTGVGAGNHLTAVSSQGQAVGAASAAVKVPTSTPSATWSTGVAAYGDVNGNVGQGIYYSENVASGSWSVAFGTNSSGACQISGIVNESSGVATTLSLGAVNHAASISAATLATGSITPGAGSIVYAATTDAGGTNTADTIGASLLVLETGGNGTSWDASFNGYTRSGTAHLDNVAASPVNPTWTLPGGTAVPVTAGIIEFKAAAAASGIPPGLGPVVSMQQPFISDMSLMR